MPALRRSRSQPPADLAARPSPSSAPGRYRVLRADPRCYLCAENFGALEAAPTAPNLETIVHRVERIDWAIEQPRRGRPPRWLVALRAQQDAA